MKSYFSMGELAKFTGVSYKTIRLYVEKGLLYPSGRTEKGYYQFSEESIEQLQRILLLKYLNFPLDEIKQMIKEDSCKNSFEKQEALLLAEKTHLEQILKAVQEIKNIDQEERWDKMIQIIQMTSQKEALLHQYRTDKNLQTRINIHQYSTAKEPWSHWLYHRLNLHSGMRILEIGCGNGNFWIENYTKLPENLIIYLTDNSEGMLSEAKRKLEIHRNYFEQRHIQFVFSQIDAEYFSFDQNNFDRIIANHMLYHVSNKARPELFRICHKLLKENGMLMASTVGNTHLQQLYELIFTFDKNIKPAKWLTANFKLENGKEQLEKTFTKVTMEEHKNDLLVPYSQVIYDYILSLPGYDKQFTKEKLLKFKKYLDARVSLENPFFIHKSTGVFLAYKK